MKIFYSWQSDYPKNRNFIQKCLEEAVSLVDGFEIDTATRDEVGSPDIAATIFKKIDESSLFIGDVSIINPDSVGRKCPNPNVLYELGYAVKAKGDANIILIANTETTDTSELPFDIRNRRMMLAEFRKENKHLVVNALVNAMTNHRPLQLESAPPTVLFDSTQARWAGNYSQFGAAFLVEFDVDNFGGEQNYITNVKIDAVDGHADHWETKYFGFEDMPRQKPLHVQPGQMISVRAFVSDDFDNHRPSLDLDTDSVEISVSFRSGKVEKHKLKPIDLSQAG